MDDGAVPAVITPSIERSVRGASHKMAAEHQHGRDRQEEMTRIRRSAPNTLICCSHVFENTPRDRHGRSYCAGVGVNGGAAVTH